jgi:hypothetical protein
MGNHTKRIISYLPASVKRLVLHRECMLASRCKVIRVDLKGGFSVKNQAQNHVIKKEPLFLTLIVKKGTSLLSVIRLAHSLYRLACKVLF